MERTYDLFEIEPDGAVRWKCAITGHELAIKKLHELARQTDNEVRVIHIPTHSIVAVMNENSPTRVKQLLAGILGFSRLLVR